MKYVDSERGKIINPARKRQLIDFSGVKYGRITPTDIDGFFEVHDKMFVFYEYKYLDAKLSGGQSKALTRLIDALAAAGKEAVLVICRHEIENPELEIDGANTVVDEYYYKSKWHSANNRTVRELTDSFMNYTRDSI